MKKEKQIVLFLKKNYIYDHMKLATELNETIGELNNPVILPPDDKDPNRPLIIYNNEYMNLTMNYNDISFSFPKESKKDCFQLFLDIVELLENFGLDFIRMGYVSTHIHTKNQREKFKQATFKDDSLIKKDFQLSWYSKELIDSVLVNVWERHLTDFNNNIEFLSIFDINTPIEEEYNINSDFLKEFIGKCDKFIEVKLKNKIQ